MRDMALRAAYVALPEVRAWARMRISRWLTTIAAAAPALASAQTAPDTFSLHRLLADGTLSVHVRQFSMFTNNAPGLSDYFAIAAGASMSYRTRPWRGFQASFGGEFVTDIASSDFSRPDPSTGAFDRYNIGLYEVLELNHKTSLARVSTLNLRYYPNNRLQVVWGKQSINTPLVNPQDGRMNISIFEGLYAYLRPISWLNAQGGVLWAASPRSTNRWFDIPGSLGIYSNGRRPDGQPYDYRGKIPAKQLYMAQVGTERFGKTNLYLYSLPEVMNVFWVQSEHGWAVGADTLQAGLILLGQSAARTSPEFADIYVPKDLRTGALSVMLAWQSGPLRLQAAYTQIADAGQFIWPREWGRETFYTFMPRERVEGSSNVRACNLRAHWTTPSRRWAITVGAGHYQLPDPNDYARNKYGMPSYNHYLIGGRYAFGGVWQGLEAQWVLVYKQNQGNLFDNPRYRINKVDMGNYNLIFNYRF